MARLLQLKQKNLIEATYSVSIKFLIPQMANSSEIIKTAVLGDGIYPFNIFKKA